jgi:ABC-type Fe3+/spermidine/putrescine transport system ATPase subunit
VDDDPLVLRVSGLTKSYGSVAALKGVEFGLRRGEVMALLGENGAGKSTLVKILAGLEHPDAGQIEIDGLPARLAAHPSPCRPASPMSPRSSASFPRCLSRRISAWAADRRIRSGPPRPSRNGSNPIWSS